MENKIECNYCSSDIILDKGKIISLTDWKSDYTISDKKVCIYNFKSIYKNTLYIFCGRDCFLLYKKRINVIDKHDANMIDINKSLNNLDISNNYSNNDSDKEDYMYDEPDSP